MGVLTDKNIIIGPPRATILNTMAVDKFQKDFPSHYEKLQEYVQGWAIRHIADIGKALGEDWMSDGEGFHIPVPDACYDIVYEVEDILRDLMVDADGEEIRQCWTLSNNMGVSPGDCTIEMRIMGLISDHCANIDKIPGLMFIKIEF